MTSTHHFLTEKRKRILLISICLSLAAQVNLPLAIDGFMISLAVILLPIFLAVNDDLNPLPICVSVALASPLFRGLILLISKEMEKQLILQYIAGDIFFYLCYGLIYYSFYWRKRTHDTVLFFCTLIIADYVSNLLEISLLLNFQNYTPSLFNILFTTALIRSVMSSIFVYGYHYLSQLLRKEKHEQRYHYFLWLSSAVKTDVYFMEKNISEIEDIMKHAYLLNKELASLNIEKHYQQTALKIACDVHDIKKDYQNLLLGLKSYFNSQDEEAMSIEDVIIIVVEYARSVIRERYLEILITTDIKTPARVKKHFYLVSVLSNLINNSIDALENEHNGQIHIHAYEEGDYIYFNVSDNGPGIPVDERELIFNPGFSTKFNERTGDIYRGIGLAHVKTMLNEKFHGDIKLEPVSKSGATFQFWIQKED